MVIHRRRIRGALLTFLLLVGQGGSGVLGEKSTSHGDYLYHFYGAFSDFCHQKPRKLIRGDILSKAPRWVFHRIATPEFNGDNTITLCGQAVL